ncbi:hypothetical protein HDK77DRAFT_245186 [Phyllosticta capitalensis]
MPSRPETENEPFYAYDSDCEACNDGAALLTLYDFDGICQCVAFAGIHCWENIEKIAHGTLYKVFLLTDVSDKESPQKAIMKITHPSFGPSAHVDKTVNSEGATMRFASREFNLPVPEVLLREQRGYLEDPKGFSNGLWWDSVQEDSKGDPDPWPYPVTKHLLIREAEGTRLSQAWKQLDSKSQVNAINEILKFEKKLASHHFEWHGCLYIDREYGCNGEKSRYKLIGFPMDGNWVADPPPQHYYMGPYVGNEALGTETRPEENHHGPWSSAVEYVKSVLKYEIDCLSKYDNSPDVQIKLLKEASSIVENVFPKNIESAPAQIQHPHLSFDNIFVDEQGHIKSVIGWRGAWVGPAFAAQPPTAFEFCGHDEVLALPEAFISQLKPEASEEISQQLLARTEEHREATNNPISSLINIAMKTREYGILPLKHYLIQVQRHWDRFEAESPCPYEFTTDEVKQHLEELEGLGEGEEAKVKRACLQATRWLQEKAGGVVVENDWSEFRRCFKL